MELSKDELRSSVLQVDRLMELQNTKMMDVFAQNLQIQENMRVLEWIIGRCNGEADAVETPIGMIPTAAAINTRGIDTSASTLSQLLEVDRPAWSEEIAQIREYLESYGERLPERMLSELEKISAALNA